MHALALLLITVVVCLLFVGLVVLVGLIVQLAVRALAWLLNVGR